MLCGYSCFHFFNLFISGYGVLCTLCKKWFSAQATLTKHKIWHHKSVLPSFKYNCDHCPYGSNELTNFRKHALVHDFTRPYACKVCGNRFIALHSLSTHTLIHDGEANSNLIFRM